MKFGSDRPYSETHREKRRYGLVRTKTRIALADVPTSREEQATGPPEQMFALRLATDQMCTQREHAAAQVLLNSMPSAQLHQCWRRCLTLQLARRDGLNPHQFAKRRR